VETDGLGDEVAKSVENCPFTKGSLAFHEHSLTGVSVDLPVRTAYGHTEFGSLHFGKFNASMKGAQS
jgi:hypothetical protein